MHIPVLLDAFLQQFSTTPLSTFLDATIGAGGHAHALLTHHPEIKQFVGIDQDPLALELSKEKLSPFSKKVELLRGNFGQLDELVPGRKFDGILADIGFSSMQIDNPARGFSFLHEGPLDMRMNPDETLTADEILNTWSEEALCQLFFDYGQEPLSRRAARKIVEMRPFKTTKEVADLLKHALFKKGQTIHPATRIFQALRIAVNHELAVLESFLTTVFAHLNPNARLAIITFHSLEDRIVKTAFRKMSGYKGGRAHGSIEDLNQEIEGIIVTKKPIVATEEEIALNPRCRSAKMRVIEKKGE